MTQFADQPSVNTFPIESQEQLAIEYQSIFRNASVGLLLTADRKIKHYNPKFAELFGFQGMEAVGMTGRSLYRNDEEYFELGRLASPALSIGKPVHHELYMQRRDGGDLWVSLVGYLAVAENPSCGTWWVIQDRTDFKRADDALRKNFTELKETNLELEQAQNQLLQSEQLASIGQLAAGVAHEINNPIGFIQSNIGSLERYHVDFLRLLDAYAAAEPALKLDQDSFTKIEKIKQEINLSYLREDLQELVSECQDGIKRVRDIVQDLKYFSRVDSSQQWEWVDLHKGLNSTLNIANSEIKFSADVIKEYVQLPEVQCLASQLNQVFMNLLVNAAHAMKKEQRGKITLRTGCEGDQVWVEVADNGSGIKPENLERIFDPFFTTKSVGKGTGLGLSLSSSIVKKHHGSIDVKSELGVGTTFRVTLPIKHTMEVSD